MTATLIALLVPPLQPKLPQQLLQGLWHLELLLLLRVELHHAGPALGEGLEVQDQGQVGSCPEAASVPAPTSAAASAVAPLGLVQASSAWQL